MPPKKFQNLDDFLNEQPKDPNLVPSPYGGYFKTNNYQQQQQRTVKKDWNQGSKFQRYNQGNNNYYNNYTNYNNYNNYNNYQQYSGYKSNYQSSYYGNYQQSSVTPNASQTPTPSASTVSLTSLNDKLGHLKLSPISTLLSQIPDSTNITELK